MPRPSKRSFSIKGHRTSLSLEQPFWDALREVSASRNLAMAALVTDIDKTRSDTGLSSAVRIYLLHHYRSQLQETHAQEREPDPRTD